jgi:hypothetical protein
MTVHTADSDSSKAVHSRRGLQSLNATMMAQNWLTSLHRFELNGHEMYG